MGFKKYSKNLSFMDLELKRIFGRSRTQQFLSEVDTRIDWKPIEQILRSTPRANPMWETAHIPRDAP